MPDILKRWCPSAIPFSGQRKRCGIQDSAAETCDPLSANPVSV